MNRRGPGRKCCCHTDALHAGYHVYSSHGWFLSRIIEFLFTRSIAESHGLIVPNLRIVEFLFTRRVTESLGIYVTNYRIVEFLFTRRVTEVFFVTRHVLGHEFARLVLGPTDQREVIIEFLSSRGMSRMVTDVYLEFSFLYRDLSFGPTGQREVIIELVYFHTENRGESRPFCPETCPLDPLTNGK